MRVIALTDEHLAALSEQARLELEALINRKPPPGLELVDGVICIKASFPPDVGVYGLVGSRVVKLNRSTGEAWFPVDPDRLPDTHYNIRWESRVDEQGHVHRTYKATEKIHVAP